MTLATFNALPADEAVSAMLACCASRRFAAFVSAGRPYASVDALVSAVSVAFASLTWDDVREAMDGHPRIGARVSGLSGLSAQSAQSAAEQSGVEESSRAALALGNAAYEERFGHVFLICASGLSGSQMLAALRERLTNDPSSERAVATAELEKITVLRVREAVRP